MAAKITSAQIRPAVAKLALPDFVLKEVKAHQKGFEDAVSTYRRKFFFNRKFEETKEALAQRWKNFAAIADPALTTIYTVYKTYGLHDKKRQPIGNSSKIQAIVDDVEKKLAALKKAPFYEFDSSDITPEIIEALAVPTKEVKKCEDAKKKFDAAVKKFGSASLLSKRPSPGGDRFVELKADVPDHIACIYAAEDYYYGTVGFPSLKKIADSVRKTVQSIEKDNKGQTLFAKVIVTPSYLKPVPAVADSAGSEHAQITALWFSDHESGYVADYENYLIEAIKIYTISHDALSKQKKKTKFVLKQHKDINDLLINTHGFLKKLEELKSIQEELTEFIAKNPALAIALKDQLRKVNSQKLPATIGSLERKYHILSYTIKYSMNSGYEFRNMDAFVDAYARAIENLISVFSNPKSSIDQCLKAITDLKQAKQDAEDPELIPGAKSQKKRQQKPQQKRMLTAKDATEYTEKLDDMSKIIIGETDNWDKQYDDFQKKLAKYREDHSTAKKVVRVAKVLGLIAALAAGAAQINASIDSKGVVLSTVKAPT